MVSLALSLDKSTWNGQMTIKAGFSLLPILLFFLTSLLSCGAIYTIEKFYTSFLLMIMAYLSNLMQISLWELDQVHKDSEDLFSIASTADEHQMTFTLSPFDQPHAAVLFPVVLPSLAAFYTMEENVIVGLGFVVMACVSFLALYGLYFPSPVNSPAFDFWAEWTGLKLCETLIPPSPEDRSQQFEVLHHRILGPEDDERERSEERSLISEAEYLEEGEEGVGENNVQNQGAEIEGLKDKGLKFGIEINEDEWEYIKNSSLHAKDTQSES
ncbi:hypothetical protein POPTR_002G015500v4 [Populus trichocarpa]|uniref:Uncharacterized protein n=1 Tax=Populus trichocarpa TaxID=3694 RepID=A0ACC0TBG8_POPTR|nr:uncharacterized protein LOC7490617 isoform X2 [Populus trichocarpa]KAI9398874.1 hypothetical protein POPTR_002G015500v4 [Populus trichocarpa]